MNQLFKTKAVLQKIIVYATAALLFTPLPVQSVCAAESAQIPPPQNTPAESIPAESTPAESVPAPSTPPENPPAESQPSAGTPNESQPSAGTPNESAPSESIPAPSTPGEGTPSESTPAPSTPESQPGQTTPPVQNPSDTGTPPAQNQPGQTTPPAQNPSDTGTPPAQQAPNPTPSDQNTVQVTPMQSTVYAATQNGLNVRSGPSTKHSKIGTLQYGQEITVTGKTADNWYQIKYAGGTGYVLADYVSATPLTDTGHPDTDTPDVQPSAPVENPDSEALPDTPVIDDITNNETDTDASTAVENDSDTVSSLLGTPIVVILAVAILGVVALIAYSVYNLFRRDNTLTDEDGEYYEDEYYEDEYYEDEYYEDEYYEDNGDGQDLEDEYYEDNGDGEYYEDEYYEDEQHYKDEYYEDDEDMQYSDDKYREEFSN